MEQYQKIWDKIKYQLQMTLDDDVYNEHFFGISNVFKVINNTIYLISPNSFIKSKIESFYLNRLNAMLNEYLPEKHLFKIITKEQAAEEIAKTSSYEINVPEPDLESKYKTGLNNSYTFDNFVVGSSNRLAYTSAMKVADQPGVVANPFYIFGDVGLGKTHLLHAIGNAVKEKFPSLRVLYVHAQDFLNEYIKYVTGDKEGNSIVDWFKESVDVLLVDDVQFLVNKQKTEETFFSIYNNFYAAQKQVVLTCDQHPSKLNGLDERLKSRFVQGLPLSINPPEKETCEEILRLRITANNLSVEDFDPEVITFFATRFSKNIRELEGAFDRLIFYTVNIHPTKHIDLNTAMDSVSSLIDVQNDKTKLSEDKVINVVADYYNLAPYQLTGKIRTSQIALARHIAMYLIRTLLDVPFTKIGIGFGGKDHATVMNGVNKVENSIKTDKNLQKAVAELTSRLKE